jgi:hypothetical protein
VHQNIQASPILLYFVKQAVEILNVPHVGLNEQDSMAVLLNLVDSSLRGFAVPEEVHNHVRSTGREVQCNGAADPSPGSGDERDSTFEFRTYRLLFHLAISAGSTAGLHTKSVEVDIQV